VIQEQRHAAVKGSFYPDNCTKLEIYFRKFSESISKETKAKPIFDIIPKAIIVPHAGYIYSGFTANIAYTILPNSSAKRVVVIGPSHHHYFEGISGSYYDNYETPCGDLDIDTAYLIDLAKKFNIGFEPKAHQQEHSTEVQMPFVQHYLPQAKVIELIYGKLSPLYLQEIIKYLIEDPENVIIISTDLSHFYTQKQAKKLDHICLDAVATRNSQKFDEGCEACGMIGLKAIIGVAKDLGLKSQLLDYRTSADYSGDETRVVGYASAVIYK